MKKESTREKVLAVAAELIHRQGFNHTGIQEILANAGVPKGSFYFYFKSKEDLGLALIERYGEVIRTRARSFFSEALRPPLERLRSFFQSARTRLEADGCQKGCPIGNLCQEMSDLSPVFRQKLEAVLASVAGEVAGLLRQARQAGELPAHLDPEDTARFILSSWQGALLIMKVEKSVEPLHRFERFIFGEILSGGKSDSTS
jgi:TetR/AcrR family transcriptional regulator, transcriptional repressor for nem operon